MTVSNSSGILVSPTVSFGPFSRENVPLYCSAPPAPRKLMRMRSALSGRVERGSVFHTSRTASSRGRHPTHAAPPTRANEPFSKPFAFEARCCHSALVSRVPGNSRRHLRNAGPCPCGAGKVSSRWLTRRWQACFRKGQSTMSFGCAMLPRERDRNFPGVAASRTLVRKGVGLGGAAVGHVFPRTPKAKSWIGTARTAASTSRPLDRRRCSSRPSAKRRRLAPP